MKCIKCKAEIPADNISVKNNVAKCNHCNALFLLNQSIDPTEEQQLSGRFENLKVEHLNDAVIYTRRWLTSGLLMASKIMTICFFSLFIFAMGFSFYIDDGPLSFMPLVTLSPFMLFCLYYLYYTLAVTFNKTTVHVSKKSLKVSHGPFPVPFYSNVNISAKNIKQLYCVEKFDRSSYLENRYFYTVRAMLSNNKTIPILKEIRNTEQALQLERDMENFLGIAQAKVKGAVNSDAY